MIPDVSIVIPAKIRNQQEHEWLIAALHSAESQAGPYRIEIILIDDHSLIELSDIQRQFSDVRWLQMKSKSGLAAARNAGVLATRTEFFFSLDADDLLPPDAIKLAMDAYPGDGFLYGATRLFDDTSEMIYPAKPYNFDELMKAVYWPNGCLQRKENWRRVGGWNEKIKVFEDWNYWLSSGEIGICGHHIDQILYHYRRNPNGMISRLKSDRLEYNRSVQSIKALHQSIYRGVYPMGCCGGNRNKVTIKPAVMPKLPGADGMVLIQYIGGNAGKSAWYGPVTGTRYEAGGSQPLIYIDARDAATNDRARPGLLDMYHNSHPLFQQVLIEKQDQAAEITGPAIESDAVEISAKKSGRKAKVTA